MIACTALEQGATLVTNDAALKDGADRQFANRGLDLRGMN